MSALTEALAARFTDADEIQDVAKYGCVGGVSGFIYSSELCDFFEEHETEIEDIMEMLDIKYFDLVPDAQSIQQYREAAVWLVVEDYCQNQVLEAEAEYCYA